MLFFTLGSEPYQEFTSSVNGVSYTFTFQYCSRYGDSGVWSMSVRRSNTVLVSSLPLLQGVNLLRQHSIGIKDMYVLSLNSNADPTLSTFQSNNTETLLLILEEGEEIAALG